VFNSDLKFKDSYANSVELVDFQSKVLLLINTATKCGFAPQFEELEKLYQDYKDKGLVVIGFPSDTFAQEPEENETMAETCKVNFGVTFPLSEKIEVNGPNTHPIFKYLKEYSKSSFGKDIKWNFTKFLVSRDGKTILRYAPSTRPEKLRPMIEKLLAK